eukprot:jgi/Pico_ML_1/55376/g1070.t1
MDVLRELVEDELRAVPYAYLAKKCQVDVDEAKRMTSGHAFLGTVEGIFLAVSLTKDT